jgi:hypothetical protein
MAALVSGKMVELTDEIWKRLPNTNSYKITKKEAERHATKYGKDIGRIMHGMQYGAELPAPIVLRTATGPYLVAGNTRLMAARVMGLRPRVWLADIRHLVDK